MFRGFVEMHRHTIPLSELNKTYGCDICDEGDWHSETEVDIHKRINHRSDLKAVLNDDNSCTICAKNLGTEEELLKHIKSIHLHSSPEATRVERELFVCDYCNDIFFNKTMLALHIVHRHQNNVSITCPLCPKEIRPRFAHGHLSTRHQFQSVALCPVCLLKRPNRTELAQHVNSHRKYYHCNICGYMSTKERDFHLHVAAYRRRPRARDPRHYRHCFIEPRSKRKYSFLSARPILDGLALSNRVYICVLCREVCLRRDRAEHVARDHVGVGGAARPRYACACGDTFATTIMLRHHVFKLQGPHRALKDDIPPQPAGNITLNIDTTAQGSGGMGGDEASLESETQDTEESEEEGEGKKKILRLAELDELEMTEENKEDDDTDSIEERFIVIVTDADADPIITVRDSGQGEGSFEIQSLQSPEIEESFNG